MLTRSNTVRIPLSASPSFNISLNIVVWSPAHSSLPDSQSVMNERTNAHFHALLNPLRCTALTAAPPLHCSCWLGCGRRNVAQISPPAVPTHSICNIINNAFPINGSVNMVRLSSIIDIKYYRDGKLFLVGARSSTARQRGDDDTVRRRRRRPFTHSSVRKALGATFPNQQPAPAR